MRIRKAGLKDFEGYFKLEQEFMKFNNSLTKIKDWKYKLIKPKIKKDFLKKVNKRNKLFLILGENKKIYGYLYGTIEKMTQKGYKFPINNIGYLSKVYITKKQRGRGYFSKLIKEFFKYLKSKRIKYCGLHVLLNNKKVVNIYKKFGFKLEEYKLVCRLK